MWNWIIGAFSDTKSKLIAGLCVMVITLGWMQIQRTINDNINQEIMTVEDEVIALEKAKGDKIKALEARLDDLEHKVDNIQNYAATGVWKAIQDNKTQIEVLKSTKRDKK